jgi:DNA mismatch repair ATPase MutS
MKCFYQLYNNKVYISSLKYSFGFNGYLENIIGFKNNQKLMSINKTYFKNKKSIFKNAYFPAIKNPIKNSYNLEKHALITGPNAAGKTTILKTTIFNILISQQIGFGFFDKANFKPFDFIHCYINIPDTSGRDSLFQAEARRCKNILDQIKNNNFRHFCIFDELYSGTNPYEAIGSAVAFLSYLNNFSNIKFMITTHFLDLCKKLKTNSNFANYHMKIVSEKNNFKYIYKLDNGISDIKGGVKVLKDLDYPDIIINYASKIINKLSI